MHIIFIEDIKMKDMQLFACIFNATKSQTLHFYQADIIELQNSKYFKEWKKTCSSVQPYTRMKYPLLSYPSQLGAVQ